MRASIGREGNQFIPANLANRLTFLEWLQAEPGNAIKAKRIETTGGFYWSSVSRNSSLAFGWYQPPASFVGARFAEAFDVRLRSLRQVCRYLQ